QPETAIVAFIFAGACLGFLVWNVSPAKIYLGEGGALLVGFMLGILAIMSGSKVATALLILGLPMLDVLAVIIRRVFIEHKSPFTGDLFHLHYQLQDKGWNDRYIVLIYYVITAGFGVSTLVLSGSAKVIALGMLLLIGLSLVVYASCQCRR
ncbi:MAG: glycosyl transferase family protein, partial [uncultured bacterium]